MPKVLISDSMSNIAQKIFEQNKIDCDVKTDLSEEKIIEIINNYDALIIANGLGLKNLIPNLKVSKGQLVGLTAEQKFKVDLPLNSEGYILPRVDGVTWIGSTYEREFTDLRPSSEECMKLILSLIHI